MKRNTCFKGSKSSCIDLLITDSKFSFMKTQLFETRWSDYYHIVWVKVFKNGSSKICKRRPLRNLK